MRILGHQSRFSWVVFGLALGLGCGGSPPAPARAPVDLASDWVLAPPESVGVDPGPLGRALDGASAVAGLESVLVVKKGQLIGERYLGAGAVDSVHAVRSVTKSVMSLLVGLAIRDGVLTGTSEPLANVFGPSLPALTGTQRTITFQHLLTMTSGFEWDENSNVAEYNTWALAPDQVAYLLARPITSAPGTLWNYDSAAVHLISAGLTAATGAGSDVFADRVLLQPLGITARDWELDNQGIPNGGAGLSLRSRDMAKLGELIVQGGESGAAQVVPEPWIQTSTQFQIATDDGLSALGRLDYADLWWLGQVGGKTLRLAWGYGGQFIYVVPDLDLVLVTTAKWQGLGGTAFAQENGIMNWIVGTVTPAAR